MVRHLLQVSQGTEDTYIGKARQLTVDSSGVVLDLKPKRQMEALKIKKSRKEGIIRAKVEARCLTEKQANWAGRVQKGANLQEGGRETTSNTSFMYSGETEAPDGNTPLLFFSVTNF